MRYLIILLLFCSSLRSKAQKFEFPKLPLRGSAISGLVPSNWKAIDTARGDLNADGLPDLALVLEFNSAVAEMRAYGDADTEIIKEIQKPRILAIYFKRKKTYDFAMQNNDFMLRDKEGGIYGDPYEGLAISNNILTLSFRGGSNWRWKLDYQFRLLHQQWTLIAAKNSYYHNASGEVDEKDYNFLTKEVKETIGNLHTENSNKTTTAPLYFGNLRTFSTFKKPWTWEIRKDEFL
ncbi:MAG: hypothetical protein REI78_00705 [Pedobacter sp.]|nr:hypothetical protein [Pedobacter sp.]MDQ8051506.1 hypothetical protein [Pedobacter sp.]